jgi:hypothetical protein
MSASETGHAKNAANFETLLSHCISYADAYKPSRESISIGAMQQKINEINLAFSSLNTATSALSIAIGNRDSAFKPLSKLLTRVLNALKASDTSPATIDSAQSLIKKIQGSRVSAILTDDEKKALEAGGKSSRQHSASQLSFDNRLANLNQLIELLRAIPTYAPNETELTTNSLGQLAENLKTLNTCFINAAALEMSLRTVRNEALYNPTSGVVALAAFVKAYVKSLYGPNSPQFKQISGLRFTLPR